MKAIVTGNIIFLVTLAFGLPSAFGVPTVGTETWDVQYNMNGWSSAVGTPPGGGASAVTVDTIGAHNYAVNIMFANQGAFPSPEDEKIFIGSGNFAGNQNYAASIISGVSFSFYANDYTTPLDTVALFFYSSTGNRTWKYSLAGPASINTWTAYGVPLSWTPNWTTVSGGQAEFNADLQDVDLLGIWVNRSGDTGQQTYGLDDFGLFVPEPSTYAIIAFTLLTLAITLRRKQPALLQVAGNN